MNNPICLLCKHLAWHCATPEYSEYTPGSDVEIFCTKEHWRLNTYEDTEKDFYEYMQSAKTCKDF